jgi:hypothetical protein
MDLTRYTAPELHRMHADTYHRAIACYKSAEDLMSLMFAMSPFGARYLELKRSYAIVKQAAQEQDDLVTAIAAELAARDNADA